MDLTFDTAERTFRDQFRAWLRSYDLPPEPDGEDKRFAWRRDFQRDLAADGWAAVHWPSEYGGRSASLTQSAIFYEELAAAGAPLAANVLGVVLAGPTILRWGSDAQKERYLRPILTAEEIWCQGFSEPDAGSDFASVKTRAVREGDEWVITGQKVWTSYAQYSKWCMLVARSDTDAPKHKGLTYFLMDMEQDGVEVVPLRQITGETEFNELFLDGARVPAENILGGVGNGWQVALTTLMNERAGLGFFLLAELRQTLDRLTAIAMSNGKFDDVAIVEQLGEMHLRVETMRLTAYRGLTATEKYGQPGPEGSLTKWLWSETNQQLTQLAAKIVGEQAVTDGNRWSHELLRARGNTIEGGTSEVLKNIIAERVLGLPKAR